MRGFERLSVAGANWSYPTAIKFGAGRIAELPEHCAAVGIVRPLIVTDRMLATLPFLREVATSLGAPMFSEVQPNPTDANLAAGLAAYREGRHDGVVAIGGGSS